METSAHSRTTCVLSTVSPSMKKRRRTYRRSCRMSLQLSMVMSDVEAAGMMMMGVLEPVDTLLHVNECSEPARGQKTMLFRSDQRKQLGTAHSLLPAAVRKQWNWKPLLKPGQLDTRMHDTNQTLTAKSWKAFLLGLIQISFWVCLFSAPNTTILVDWA